jgi:hypothetical protein
VGKQERGLVDVIREDSAIEAGVGRTLPPEYFAPACFAYLILVLLRQELSDGRDCRGNLMASKGSRPGKRWSRLPGYSECRLGR